MKPQKPIESLILTLRGQKVILDADLAELYGAPTYRFNEAFKRNRQRFPDDFAFQLTAEEFAGLRTPNSSQIAMSSPLKNYAINKVNETAKHAKYAKKVFPLVYFVWFTVQKEFKWSHVVSSHWLRTIEPRPFGV